MAGIFQGCFFGVHAPMRKMIFCCLALTSLNAQGTHIEKGNLSVYASNDGRLVGVRVGFQKRFLGIPKCEVYAQQSRITDRDVESIWILANLGEKITWKCWGAQ